MRHPTRVSDNDERFSAIVGSLVVDAAEIPAYMEALVERARALPEGEERDAAVMAAETMAAGYRAFTEVTGGALMVLEQIARAQPGAEIDFADVNALIGDLPVNAPGGEG